MKFTLSWLKDHLETEASLEEICERLTAIGLEVEDVDDKAAYKPFVIAKILTADPDEYQGFAWGMGLDRIAMLKYGMPDLRDFFNADVRWMSHYGFRPLDVPTLFGGLSS